MSEERESLRLELASDVLLNLYHQMCRIRAFEEAAEQASQGGIAAFGQQVGQSAQVRGPLHLSIGQEAVAVGVCAHLGSTDLITSTHRGHGHTLAKGASLESMMHELFGKASGYCGGRGGSMHIADFSVGMLGANGVVAAGIPIAVGAAQSLKIQGKSEIVVTFFGDGAINRGPFSEGLNWAASFQLPVLFVCEDNEWSATTRTAAMSAGPGAAARAESMGVPSLIVDGNDLEAVYAAAGKLVGEIRAGGGPRLLHARTYRIKGHVSVDPASYRDAAEVAQARSRDPLATVTNRLAARGVSAAQISQAMVEAQREVQAAVESAQLAPSPDPQAAYDEIQTVGAGQWH